MNKLPGFFISLEGIDGAGKSTHLEFIRNYIITQLAFNGKVIMLREPGGTVAGEKIRDLLLSSEHLEDISELLLMFASRQELISKVIVPELTDGACIICDRFIDSSFAYQGSGRSLGDAKIQAVLELLDDFIWPDLTFVFDLSPQLAQSRVLSHSLTSTANYDRIEKNSLEFFNRIRDKYLQLAILHNKRMHVIDASQSIAQIQQIISSILIKYFKFKNI